ncbi:serine/arginine repetitive matrix protein 2 [Streptomyces aidingensis]|uniref:serine/arginine repetitive matrix protein 2 n=1 Tax=Streptomyces aidingensis TaxID=910347 RepID=UPI00111477D9|nr:serine/arginine repetitive matrix protein 2 [Streptomyces aidingensis]
MPDFAMDYDALYAMRDGLHGLADRAEDGGATGVFLEIGEQHSNDTLSVFGFRDLAQSFRFFYSRSRSRVEEGKDKLRRFGDMFGGVADGLFQQDAMIASGAAASVGKSYIDEWRAEWAEREAWEARKEEWDGFLAEIGATEYFQEHPDADPSEVCSAGDGRPDWCQAWEDHENKVAPPGAEPPVPDDHPPSRLRYEGEDGSSTEVVLSYDEDYNIMREETTITTAGGETFTSAIAYDGPPEVHTVPHSDDPDHPGLSYDSRDYTVTSNGPDGSTAVEKVVINDDGSGTRSITTTYPDGEGGEKTETTEYTRSGPFADWEEKQ